MSILVTYSFTWKHSEINISQSSYSSPDPATIHFPRTQFAAVILQSLTNGICIKAFRCWFAQITKKSAYPSGI